MAVWPTTAPIYVDKLDSLESFYQIFKAYYMTKKAERPDRWMVICDSARPQTVHPTGSWDKLKRPV